MVRIQQAKSLAAALWFGCEHGIGASQDCQQPRHLDELRGPEGTARDMEREEKEGMEGGGGGGMVRGSRLYAVNM